MTAIQSNPTSPLPSTSKLPPLSSPSTLPPDIAAPPRVVQKQVVQIRGHSKGCSIVLFLRLALPKSSKVRSFPLFPDEGVKLKSSAVYPVSIDKVGKTILPNDASPGLKRASRILAIGPKAGPIDAHLKYIPSSDDNDEESNRSVSDEQHSNGNKKAKPRITTSNFHITIVSPQTRDHHEDRVEKLYYLAVIQIEVGLSRRPPLWPFEAHIPIPRCLNNKLHFTTEEEEIKTGESFVVEFEPSLVPRPAFRISSLEADLDTSDQSLTEDGSMDSDAPSAVSGPFPATNTIIARWAGVHTAEHPEIYPQPRSGRLSVRAQSLASEGQIIDVTKVDEEQAQIKLRFHVIIRGCSYPGLDSTAAIDLRLKSNTELDWMMETLSVQSERSKTLHSWSTDGKEFPSISRSSTSSSIHTDSIAKGNERTTHPPIDIDSTIEEGTNLIDIRPPKGVVDKTSDDTSFDNSMLSSSISPTILTPKKSRKASISSRESKASEYSQKSADNQELALHLFVRTSAIRNANLKGEELAFAIEGSVKTRILQEELDGTFKVSCPVLIAQNIPSQATISSISEEIELAQDSSEEKRKSILFSTDASHASAAYADIYKHPVKFECDTAEDVGVMDRSGDYSTSTVGFAQGRTLYENIVHASSNEDDEFEDLRLQTITSNDSEIGSHQIGGFSGIIEEVDTTIWITNGIASVQKPRKVVHRIHLSWPRALASSDNIPTANGVSQRRDSLLPLIVFALPRTWNDERIEILHVSVQGMPIDLSSTQREDNDFDQKEDGLPSKILDISLPEQLRKPDGPVSVTILYSVEGPSTMPICVFPPIASSVVYFHGRIHDERLQSAVPVLSYINEPIASGIQFQEQQSLATIYSSMVPAMTKISLDYVERTKPLIPLATSPFAPLRRQSGLPNRAVSPANGTSSVTSSITVPDVMANSRSPSPSKQIEIVPSKEVHPPPRQQLAKQRFSSPPQQTPNRLITWATFHAFITVLLATSLYNVIFTVLPSVQNVSRKVDVMGLALNIDFIHDTPEIFSSFNQLNHFTSSNPINSIQKNEEDLNDKFNLPRSSSSSTTSSLSTSTSNISDFFLWFSSTVSWPLREVLKLFGILLD